MVLWRRVLKAVNVSELAWQSFDRDSRFLDGCFPLRALRVDELCEFSGCHATENAPHAFDPRPEIGISDDVRDRLAEFLNDGLRCAGWNDHAVPRREVVSLESGFVERRNILHCRHAVYGGDGQAAQHAAFNKPSGSEYATEDDGNLTANYIWHRRTVALVRYMSHLYAGHGLEHFAGEVGA